MAGGVHGVTGMLSPVLVVIKRITGIVTILPLLTAVALAVVQARDVGTAMNVTLVTVDATISVETPWAATSVNASLVTSVSLEIRQSVLVSTLLFVCFYFCQLALSVLVKVFRYSFSEAIPIFFHRFTSDFILV